MSIRVLPGEDPTTCEVRQDTSPGRGYDYMRTVLDLQNVSILIRDLAEQQSRMIQFLARKG